MNNVAGSWLKWGHIDKMPIYTGFTDSLHFEGKKCTDSTDSYSMGAQGNKHNNNDVTHSTSSD